MLTFVKNLKISWRSKIISVNGTWLKDKLEEIHRIQSSAYNEVSVGEERTAIGDGVGNQIGLQHFDYQLRCNIMFLVQLQ